MKIIKEKHQEYMKIYNKTIKVLENNPELLALNKPETVTQIIVKRDPKYLDETDVYSVVSIVFDLLLFMQELIDFLEKETGVNVYEILRKEFGGEGNEN